MTYLIHLADRVIGRPLLIHPQKLETIAAVLGARIGLDDFEAVTPEASRFRGATANGGMYRRDGSTAFIPVIGSLVNRGAYVGAVSGLTSYEGLEAQLDAAMSDPNVARIVLDINSPGGEAMGMYRFARKVRAAREQKPVIAYVNDMAASAAYGIASQATEIVASESSIIGSIGVVMMHVDRSAEMAKAGRKHTFIFAGAHKVDGHPYAELPESVRADLQAEVDQFYASFVALVAEGRPKLSVKAIRATEARTYVGADAVTAALADRIGDLDAILKEGGGARVFAATTVEKTMDDQAETKPAATPQPAQPVGDAAAAARSAERARIGAILRSEEAQGRADLAAHLAFETETSADAAIAMLAKALKKEAVATAPSYDAVKAAAGALTLGAMHDQPAPKKLSSSEEIYQRRAEQARGNR
ncbi:MAG: S49 family peptidase [Hyphomicrobiales bacterium]|nr:S49 family peptidase [Hyphomicrobiales bacterium]